MANNSLTVSQFPQCSNVAPSDRVVVLFNANSTTIKPSLRTITVSSFSANIIVSNSTPANSTANGIAGTIAYDSNFIYVAIANNIWKRATLTTW